MSAPESVSPVLDPPLSTQTPVKQSKASWEKAVENGPSLSEHVLEIGLSDGKEVVEVPDEVIANSVPLWDDLLEGRFLDKAPHVARIHYIVNKIWPLGDKSIKIDVFEVNETTVKFRIKNADTRKRVLRRGMWNIANIPMVLSKWSPEEEDAEMEEITTIPMWIIMKNVPRRMFSWEGLGFLASAVGKPKRLHPDTLLCNSFEEAKVFVEANMTKELPTHHHFKSKLGVDADVEFVYPWMPDRCIICSKWGHLHQACRSKVKILKKDMPMDKDCEENTSKRGNERTRAQQTNEVVDSVDSSENERVLSGKATGGAERAQLQTQRQLDTLEATSGTKIAESEAEHGSESTSGKIKETEENKDKENLGWSNVSPSKMGRSGSKEMISDQLLSSPSRFAILSVEEDHLEAVNDNGDKEEVKETEEGEIIPEIEDEAVGDNEVTSTDTRDQDVADKREKIRRLNIPRSSRGKKKSRSVSRGASAKDSTQSIGGKKTAPKKL
ncbi:hypothetical protein N665_0632s0006 [Sinapis alba]|nr:hypothetical protein N665_0632s0006 [Sinapis alba]